MVELLAEDKKRADRIQVEDKKSGDEIEAEEKKRAQARTSVGNNNEDDNQGGDMPIWMFKEVSNRRKTKKGDSKKKPAQLKKTDNHATQDVKAQEGTTEGKCVARPVLTRSQAKKSDKIHR